MRFRDYRWPCNYVVLASGPGGEAQLVVRNVSETGAKVTGGEGWGPGDRLTLDYRGGPIPAEVRWAAGGQLGLRFGRPLTAHDLSVIRGAAHTATSSDHSWMRSLRELT